MTTTSTAGVAVTDGVDGTVGVGVADVVGVNEGVAEGVVGDGEGDGDDVGDGDGDDDGDGDAEGDGDDVGVTLGIRVGTVGAKVAVGDAVLTGSLRI